VAKFGIDTASIFGFWDLLGGRCPWTRAIGSSNMLSIGPDNFHALLNGFHQMDNHFRIAPFERNMTRSTGASREPTVSTPSTN
jgi:glucose-6-phosphate isomerase